MAETRYPWKGHAPHLYERETLHMLARPLAELMFAHVSRQAGDRVSRELYPGGAAGARCGAWFGTQFAGERIPTFAEVLERYQGQMHIHTEIKGRAAHLAPCTADVVRQYGMVDHVTATSFQKPRLEEMRAYAPELPDGWLVRGVSDATIAQAHELGLTQICPRANTMTPAFVRRLHAEGFVVRAWGVADEALMRQVVEAGADGMTVNVPDTLLAYVQRASRQG